MNKQAAKIRIDKLKKEINHHRYLYHVLDRQEISDAASDSLKKELVRLEDEFDLLTGDSPSQRIGGKPLDKFVKVKHEIKQWSFNDAFEEKEARDFAERIKRMLEGKGIPVKKLDYIAELKIDGLHVVLIYQKGVLKTGATRGDGVFGEDVTNNLKTIESIPLKLEKPVDAIVEGEVWLGKLQFARLNQERKRRGEAEFANPRNAAAGAIRQLDPKIVRERKLDCFIYDLSKASVPLPNTQQEELRLLKQLGFKVNRHYTGCKNIDDVIKFWKKWEKQKDREDYWIDGIVVKVNRRIYQEALGYTGKAPRYALAFKFAADQTTTIVEDIKVQVGRTGALTPVAHLKPVRLAGSVVKRATLHNEDEIKRLGLKIGDTVIIQKAGDIIPDVVKVLPKLRTGKEKKFIIPKKCSICGHLTKRESGEAATYCTNSSCYAKNKEHLTHFVSKGAFNIVGLGDKLISKLMDEGILADAHDIFKLSAEDMAPLEGLGEKSAYNLIAAINKAKKISLDKFIFALGIRFIGAETADLVARFIQAKNKAFDSPDKLVSIFNSLSQDDIKAIPGIGEKSGESIKAWFANRLNQKLLHELSRAGIHFAKAPTVSYQQKFLGKTFVLTGTLISMEREEAKDRLKSLGANVSSQVSRNTDGLIVGENPGSKLAKAKKFGIRIINEKEFLDLINL